MFKRMEGIDMNFTDENCRMIVTTKDKKGKPITEYTTWIRDNIFTIINIVPVKFNMSAGEEMTIVIESNAELSDRTYTLSTTVEGNVPEIIKDALRDGRICRDKRGGCDNWSYDNGRKPFDCGGNPSPNGSYGFWLGEDIDDNAGYSETSYCEECTIKMLR